MWLSSGSRNRLAGRLALLRRRVRGRKDLVNPLAIEGFVVLQAISVAVLIVLSFSGSAAFLRILDFCFGSASAQRARPIAFQTRETGLVSSVPRVVLLRTALSGPFEALVSELARCDTPAESPEVADAVLSRYLSEIRQRALRTLAETRKPAATADISRHQD
jgi:hypothetical protein